MLERVELHMQLADTTERMAELRETLLHVPGVQSVGEVDVEDASIQATVTVGYNPEITNPILIEDNLRQDGFAVISASEK